MLSTEPLTPWCVFEEIAADKSILHLRIPMEIAQLRNWNFQGQKLPGNLDNYMIISYVHTF